MLLEILQSEYYELGEIEERKKYYYTKRELYNTRLSDDITQASLFIFLNKTCFNGLYRVNKKNEFNVPMGEYKNPIICDTQNIMAVSKALLKVEIISSNFDDVFKYIDSDIDKNILFYFDPPYRPISETSSFESYTKDGFGDDMQVKLKEFCDKIHNLGYKWILSNSDSDGYFDELYKDYKIERIQARRNINSKGSKRGKIAELLITNI